MPTTATYGWTTPASSAANDVPTDLASLASQVENTTKTLHEDVAWATLSLLNGFTVVSGYPLQIRRIGKVVELRGMVTIPGSGQSNAICNIPVAYRPSGNRWLQAAVASSNKAVVMPTYDAALGTISMATSYWTATPTGLVSITGTWTVG